MVLKASGAVKLGRAKWFEVGWRLDRNRMLRFRGGAGILLHKDVPECARSKYQPNCTVRRARHKGLRYMERRCTSKGVYMRAASADGPLVIRCSSDPKSAPPPIIIERKQGLAVFQSLSVCVEPAAQIASSSASDRSSGRDRAAEESVMTFSKASKKNFRVRG
jgi:hypothetical protein